MPSFPDWFQGAVDLHAHASPSLFPRRFDDIELARHAASSGMSAIVVKAHEGSSVERAVLAERAVPGARVRGGIVLNRFVGGFNPHAVEAALAQGGRIVWMPTLHAENHLRFYGGPGFREQETSFSGRPLEPLDALDDRGRLKREVHEVLDAVAQFDEAVLSNGHLGAAETRAVFREARRRGIEKLVVAHPSLPLTSFGVELQRELARLGALMEHTYLPHLPRWGGLSVERSAEDIRRVGVDRCLLSSDLGQSASPSPAEGLVQFGLALLEQGISREDLRRMLVDHPAALLDVASAESGDAP